MPEVLVLQLYLALLRRKTNTTPSLLSKVRTLSYRLLNVSDGSKQAGRRYISRLAVF